MNQSPHIFDQFFSRNIVSSNRSASSTNSFTVPSGWITSPTRVFPTPGGGFPFPGMGFPSPGSGFPGIGFPSPGSSMPSPGGPSSTQSMQAPQSAPPQHIPPKPASVSTFMVEPALIAPCRFRFTYVWLRNGSQFWFYPIIIGRNSVGGFIWNRNRWVYHALDTRLIDAVSCM